MSDIHFILTGGTIEKSYDPLTEKPELRYSSILPKYLETIVKLYPEIQFQTVSQIDSSQMTDEIRAQIKDAIESSEHKRVVIIHGTSTMPETARFLKENLKDNDKTVVLTGAMIPLKEFAMSDAGFNLGYALAKAQDINSGVYIAMNAKLFDADNVKKNTQIGRFEEI